MTQAAVATLERIERVVSVIIGAANSTNIRQFNAFPDDQDVSFEDWVKRNANGTWDDPSVRAQVNHITTSIVGRRPHEVGAHYFLDYIKSGSGFISLVTEGKMGAQSLKVAKGMKQSELQHWRQILIKSCRNHCDSTCTGCGNGSRQREN